LKLCPVVCHLPRRRLTSVIKLLNKSFPTFSQMTKRMRLDGLKIKPVLADAVTQEPKLSPAVVATVVERKLISKVMSVLARVLPLERDLLFLKRVRVDTGKPLVLISRGDDLEAAEELLKPHVDELVSAGLELPLKKHEIYCDPPATRSHFDLARTVWPCHFHEDKDLESLILETRPDIWSSENYEFHIAHIERASGDADGRNGAVVVDPARKVIVATATDTSDEHPLRHAAMNVIDAVAHAQGGGAWTIDHDFKDENESSYLLTGYDVYLGREPCCMCAMALVHSRAHRVFYYSDENTDSTSGYLGALGSATKLHTLPGLNHSYQVFCIKKS